MLRKILPEFGSDPVWSKVLILGLILFFVYLGDAILSFWVPTFIQDTTGSPILMGLIISFSSVVGIVADVAFPQIAKGITVKKLMIFGIATSILFSLILLQSTFTPYVIIFLLAMTVWGIYYEFFGFAEQQFVADSTPLRMHSSVWGILSVFRSLAYFLGPFIAGLVLFRGIRYPLFTSIIFAGVGFLMILLTRRKHDRKVDIDFGEVSLRRELGHWAVLFVQVWPVVVLSLLLGIIDSFFWTSGTVITEHLSKASFWGGLFLPAYMLPTVFIGFLLAKKKIYKGKKKKAVKLTFLAGLLLAFLDLDNSVAFLLIMVFISSTLLALAFPLVDGVYSDIVARMGRERKHLIGLSRSAISLAYIFGPIIAGIIASLVGEVQTFVVVGIITMMVCVVLLLYTPRKLLVPQEKLKKWE